MKRNRGGCINTGRPRPVWSHAATDTNRYQGDVVEGENCSDDANHAASRGGGAHERSDAVGGGSKRIEVAATSQAHARAPTKKHTGEKE